MRLCRIDETTRREHYYLGDKDTCFYMGEYSARRGSPHGITSLTIHDLLQPRDASVPMQESRKNRALGNVAQWLHEAFDPGTMGNATFVPMPQSGAGILTDNDDRIYRILRRTSAGLDVRRMLELSVPRATGEFASLRSGPNVLYEYMQVVLALTEPKPRVIFLIDDVLATGANFVAAKRRILNVLPDVPVYGLFIARKALESGEILPE